MAYAIVKELTIPCLRRDRFLGGKKIKKLNRKIKK
jgi:hypothetical protein